MSATAATRPIRFYEATIGKKVVMAITGFILFGFLVVHMLGNLQIFGGPEGSINKYSALLHASPEVLWGARSVLIASVLLHIRAAVQLYALKAKARPVAYAKKGDRGAPRASLFMIYSGYALGAFIIFHILHLTTGTVHPAFVEGDVFHNVSVAFKNPLIAGVYVVAMGFLSFHLNHGLFSLTQSLGLSQPVWSARVRGAAKLIAVVLAALFALIPLAIAANLVK